MARASTLQLRTLGHACLIVLEDGEPIIATDPWLIGSVYWRSWWLEKYPSEADIDLVRRSRFVYVTHSHIDHFHWPSLRRIGPRPGVLHPAFPAYEVPGFLNEHGFGNVTLKPLQWYALSDKVRVASVPVPVDDSLLIIETPNAVIFNINDGAPRLALLEQIRHTFNPAGKTAIVLKSYSPASAGALTFQNGVRTPLKSKRDFVHSMDLTNFAWESAYEKKALTLTPAQAARVQEEEAQEKAYAWPPENDGKLKKYMDQIYFARWLYRKGIGWKLTTSGRELFYRTRTREIENKIPADHDFTISLPDKVLDDALNNGILTDLGITLFVRIDTNVNKKLAYLFFILMGLRDYGHFKSARDFIEIVRFYVPVMFPKLFRIAPRRGPPQVLSYAAAPRSVAAE